jgi:hypothetical protein
MWMCVVSLAELEDSATATLHLTVLLVGTVTP